MTEVANAIGVRQPLAGVVYPAQDDLRRYVEGQPLRFVVDKQKGY